VVKTLILITGFKHVTLKLPVEFCKVKLGIGGAGVIVNGWVIEQQVKS
jgi:hypothetical protein